MERIEECYDTELSKIPSPAMKRPTCSFTIENFILTCSPHSAMRKCRTKNNLTEDVERGKKISREYRKLSDSNNMLLDYLGYGYIGGLS